MKIFKVINPPQSAWDSLTKRPSEQDSDIEEAVRDILRNVQERGDAALREYEKRFDGASLSGGFKVSEEEIAEAGDLVPEDLKHAIATAYSNILKFHVAQLPKEIRVKTSLGVTCVQKSVPINKVGLYVPGGRAPLFSTVLMLCVPAKVAGCESLRKSPVAKTSFCVLLPLLKARQIPVSYMPPPSAE